MANEFVIKKGRSNVLFDTEGNCRIPQEKLIENGWYLTTDTAQVYVALRIDNILQLKKLNECDTEFPDLESFEDRVSALEAEEKIHTFAFRNLFPGVGSDGHMYVAVDEQKSYVWFNNDYIVVGSDYEEPTVIFGGTAN